LLKNVRQLTTIPALISICWRWHLCCI